MLLLPPSPPETLNSARAVPGSLDTKAEEDATFCLIKDGTFSHSFVQRTRHWIRFPSLPFPVPRQSFLFYLLVLIQDARKKKLE
jgi:hypothetical protein